MLAATARRPGALGLPRAVALRRMTGGRRHPATMGRTCPSAGLWPVRTLCVLALCVHVAPSMYVAALRTFARPCCVLGVLVQFCRRTYLDSESARTTPPTAPAFSPGVSTPVRPCPARSDLVRLRLVRLRPAPCAIAPCAPKSPPCYCACLHCARPCYACVGCVRLRPARWGVVFVQGFAYVHLVVALVRRQHRLVRRHRSPRC